MEKAGVISVIILIIIAVVAASSVVVYVAVFVFDDGEKEDVLNGDDENSIVDSYGGDLCSNAEYETEYKEFTGEFKRKWYGYVIDPDSRNKIGVYENPTFKVISLTDESEKKLTKALDKSKSFGDDSTDEILSGISDLTCLEFLDLSDLVEIDNGEYFEGLINLRALNLYGASLTDFSFLEGMEKLEYLKLGFNEITDVSSIGGLLNLRYLNLGFIYARDISPLTNLKNLNYIELDGPQYGTNGECDLLESTFPNTYVSCCSHGCSHATFKD
jgi:hypothetical protein